MVYRSAKGAPAALDFRETAPARFSPNTLTPDGLHEDFTGHLTVGVPGTVAGMQAALRRYGTRSLARSIRPAERLAEDGFEVPQSLSEAMAANADRLKLFPTAARQFLRRGQPYPAGSTLRQPELAKTLRTIRRHGPDAFYRGLDRAQDRRRDGPHARPPDPGRLRAAHRRGPAPLRGQVARAAGRHASAAAGWWPCRRRPRAGSPCWRC